MVTQGQSGIVISGALQGIGIGVAGALVNTGSSIVQSATQAVTVPAAGGHKGGHH